MRAGALRHYATLIELGADLRPCVLGKRWLGILAKESADPPMPTGLRSPAAIDIRARFSAELIQGRYLRHGCRLFQITSARDVLGTRAELRITADEFVGQAGEYRPAEGVPVPCRVFLQHQAPWLNEEVGTVTDYRTKAEVAIIETGRVQEGDQMVVACQLYNVIGYARDSDDGVVRGLWLEIV